MENLLPVPSVRVNLLKNSLAHQPHTQVVPLHNPVIYRSATAPAAGVVAGCQNAVVKIVAEPVFILIFGSSWQNA